MSEKHVIKLGGKDRTLRFTVESVERAAEEFNQPKDQVMAFIAAQLVDALTDVGGARRLSATAAAFWSALIAEDPALTVADVELCLRNLIGLRGPAGSAPVIADAVAKLWAAAIDSCNEIQGGLDSQTFGGALVMPRYGEKEN